MALPSAAFVPRVDGAEESKALEQKESAETVYLSLVTPVPGAIEKNGVTKKMLRGTIDGDK